MQRKKNIKAHRLCNIIAIFACISALLMFCFYRQLTKHMSEICEYKGRETANRLITDAIDKQLEGSNDEYIEIIRDGNDIVSVETNSVAVNKLQNELKKSINEEFDNIKDNKMSLPLGTMSGITIFSGRGPDIGLQLHQIGALDIEMKSEFTSAGINQTKHRIILNVKVELSAILPGHSTDITVENDYLISETIIVGNVPDVSLQK